MDKRRFLENPNRAVFATRDIDAELINSVSPQIMRLRIENKDPICLYIDSLGGSVFHAQRLLDIITAPTQEKHVPWLISISIGFAASAAADLLALGNYSIAYPHSTIHYHGTRQSQENITLEDIHAIEVSLRETNENFAVRLAVRVFHRLVVRMLQIRREESPDFLFHETIADPVSFFKKLKNKISEKHQSLIDDAMERQTKVTKIINFVNSQNTEGTQPPADHQMLKAIVDYEIGAAKNTTSITAVQMETIKDDFFQIKGLFHERYWANLIDIVQRKGEYFLSPDEKNEYDKLDPKKPDERQAFLLQKIGFKLHPVWYLVVSLCQCLQHGEHSLSATDAYWIGLVDEVVGSALPCVREFSDYHLPDAS